MARTKGSRNRVPVGSIGGAANVIIEGDGSASLVGGSDNSVNDSGSAGVATADDGSIIIEPRDFGSSGTAGDGPDEPVRGRRGRKPGTSNRKKNATLDLSGIELLLYSTHGMLAQLTKVEEIALAKEEANLLAQAVVSVSEHYSFMSKVSAEAVAWANLLQVGAMIYGPRLMAYKINKKKKAEQEANVINATGMFGGGFAR